MEQSKIIDTLETYQRIMERVKRLAGNEIELGIEIPMIESWASNIPKDKGNYVCCHKGSTDKRSSWNMWEPIWASKFRY